MAQTGSNQIDALAAKLEELEAVCALLALENADLRQRVTTLMGGTVTTNGPRPTGQVPTRQVPTRQYQRAKYQRAKYQRVSTVKGRGRQAGKSSSQLGRRDQPSRRTG